MPKGLSPNQCNQIEQTRRIPPECAFLNETLHFCSHWHGMLIDESDPEFETCRCIPEEEKNVDHEAA